VCVFELSMFMFGWDVNNYKASHRSSITTSKLAIRRAMEEGHDKVTNSNNAAVEQYLNSALDIYTLPHMLSNKHVVLSLESLSP
jgi:hypothetical protein